jgi:hypothetical protein
LWGRLGVAGEEETIRKREGAGLELRQPGDVKIAIQLHRPYPSDRVDIKMAVEMLFMVVVREGEEGWAGYPNQIHFCRVVKRLCFFLDRGIGGDKQSNLKRFDEKPVSRGQADGNSRPPEE